MPIPSFSIIVPVYNCSPFLENCIKSILQAGIQDDEILLVNDGSSDSSGEICDEYAVRYPFIKTIHTHHENVANARNIGLVNATKEYLLFVDGDDEWAPSFNLSDLRPFLSKTDSELFILGYQIKSHHNKQIRSESVICPDRHYSDWRQDLDSFLSLFYNGIMFPCWNKVFKRSLLKSLCFHPQQMEDFRFVLEYLQEIKSVSFLPILPYYYHKRQLGYSLTEQVHNNMREGYNTCHQLLLSLVDKRYSKTVHQIMAPQYIAIVNKALMMDDKLLSRSLLKDIHHNHLATFSLKAYPVSGLSETVSYFLMRNGLFRILLFYRSFVSLIKVGIITK